MAKRKVHREAVGVGTRSTGRKASSAPPVAVQRSTGWRRSFERSSARALSGVSLLPTWMLPALLALILFAGLAINQPWAGGFLLAVGGFLLWLTVLSWPTLSISGRLVRSAVDVGMLVLAGMKFTGRF